MSFDPANFGSDKQPTDTEMLDALMLASVVQTLVQAVHSLDDVKRLVSQRALLEASNSLDLIDGIEAFRTIVENVSKNEVESIEKKFGNDPSA